MIKELIAPVICGIVGYCVCAVQMYKATENAIRKARKENERK